MNSLRVSSASRKKNSDGHLKPASALKPTSSLALLPHLFCLHNIFKNKFKSDENSCKKIKFYIDIKYKTK